LGLRPAQGRHAQPRSRVERAAAAVAVGERLRLARGAQAQHGQHPGFASSSNGDAGGPNFPLSPHSNAWSLRANGASFGAGSTLTLRPVHRAEFGSSYTFLTTREHERIAFDSSGNALATGGTPDSHLPTLRNRDHVLETSLRFEVARGLALKLYHRYEL